MIIFPAHAGMQGVSLLLLLLMRFACHRHGLLHPFDRSFVYLGVVERVLTLARAAPGARPGFGSDGALLIRPNISATAEFEANDGTDVANPSIEPWFEPNGICKQQALTIGIGKIWRYRPTCITKFRMETFWRASRANLGQSASRGRGGQGQYRRRRKNRR